VSRRQWQIVAGLAVVIIAIVVVAFLTRPDPQGSAASRIHVSTGKITQVCGVDLGTTLMGDFVYNPSTTHSAAVSPFTGGTILIQVGRDCSHAGQISMSPPRCIGISKVVMLHGAISAARLQGLTTSNCVVRTRVAGEPSGVLVIHN
jgi:hypothetical protein